MVDEGDQVPVRRDADVADPGRAVVQHLPDGIFEPAPVAETARDREVLAVRGPIRILNVVEDLARRPPGERDAGERPGGLVAEQVLAGARRLTLPHPSK